MKLERVKRLRVLEKESARLRQAVADLTLDKLMGASKNPWLGGDRVESG